MHAGYTYSTQLSPWRQNAVVESQVQFRAKSPLQAALAVVVTTPTATTNIAQTKTCLNIYSPSCGHT